MSLESFDFLAPPTELCQIDPADLARPWFLPPDAAGFSAPCGNETCVEAGSQYLDRMAEAVVLQRDSGRPTAYHGGVQPRQQ